MGRGNRRVGDGGERARTRSRDRTGGMLFARFGHVSERSNAQALVSAAATPPRGAEAVVVPRPAEVESARARMVAALLGGALLALPFLAVRFPPITDLPQHVAQIRLFLAALADPDGAYRIQWFTPYSAAYVV